MCDPASPQALQNQILGGKPSSVRTSFPQNRTALLPHPPDHCQWQKKPCPRGPSLTLGEEPFLRQRDRFDQMAVDCEAHLSTRPGLHRCRASMAYSVLLMSGDSSERGQYEQLLV